jgi:pimeloyl-ACP methyl ester carboxylesterase
MKTILTMCIAAALAGCTSFSPAPADRAPLAAPAPIPEDEWPARDLALVGATALPSMSELYTVQLAADAPRNAAPRLATTANTPLSRIHFNGAVGKGVLRVYDDLGAAGDRDGARFVTSWQLASADSAAGVLRARMHERTGARLLSTSVSTPAATTTARVQDFRAEGVSIALPREDVSLGAPRPRGLVLFFNGVLSSDYERPLVRTLESRGWAVVTIGTVTSVRRGAAGPIRVASSADAAREIAAAMDDALAETAYAAEAVVEYLATHRPDVPQRPLILVGCSIGACAVPVVAARLGDSVDAAILVGGGANMLDVALRSDATNLGIEVDWGSSSASIERNTDLLVEYLRASRLDPYHTAAYLAGKPVLCVHAVFDAIVPAAAGRLLYARLGSPDRLRFNGGGAAMMAMMDDIAPQIATWLDRAMYNRHAVAPRDYTRQPPPALAPPSLSETEPLPELPADNAPTRRTRGGKPAPIDLD